MFTGVNDCCRIARGVGTDPSSVELETSSRVMTGESYTPESLVLPRGIKALCKDQAMRTTVLASMLTLDEGGLAVRQVGGDPNCGIRIPSTLLDSQQRADQGPGGSCHEGPIPAGKGKEKEPVPIWKGGEERSIPTHKDDEVWGAATTRSS
jgi:hypothetical protein